MYSSQTKMVRSYSHIIKEANNMKKSIINHYDNVVVLRKNNGYTMTRLNAYKRYIKTIKPIDELIKYWNS